MRTGLKHPTVWAFARPGSQSMVPCCANSPPLSGQLPTLRALKPRSWCGHRKRSCFCCLWAEPAQKQAQQPHLHDWLKSIQSKPLRSFELQIQDSLSSRNQSLWLLSKRLTLSRRDVKVCRLLGKDKLRRLPPKLLPRVLTIDVRKVTQKVQEKRKKML